MGEVLRGETQCLPTLETRHGQTTSGKHTLSSALQAVELAPQ